MLIRNAQHYGGGGGPVESAWPAWRAAIPITTDSDWQGSSTFSGPHAPAPAAWEATDFGLTTYTNLLPPPPAGPPLGSLNYGAGGDNENDIAVNLTNSGAGTGATVRVRAAYQIWEFCGNYGNDLRPVYTSILAAVAGMKTTIGRFPELICNKHYDNAAPASIGGLDHCRIYTTNVELERSGYCVEWTQIVYRWKYVSPAGFEIADAATRATDNLPHSMQGGTPDTNHDDSAHMSGNDALLGFKSGNHILSEIVQAHRQSRMAGGVACIMIGQQVDAPTGGAAHVAGDIVCTLKRDTGGASLAGHTVRILNATPFSVAIEGGEAVLRWASSLYVTDPYVIVQGRTTQTATGYALDWTAQIRLRDNTGVSGKRMQLRSQMMLRDGLLRGVQDVTKFSVAVGIDPSQNNGVPWDFNATTNAISRQVIKSTTTQGGVDMNIKGSTNNNFSMILKDASNVSVFNRDGLTSDQFTEANGLKWCFYSIDLTAGTFAYAADNNAATTTGGTIVAGSIARLVPDTNATPFRMFATSAGARLPCGLEAIAFWDADLGFGTLANRNLIRDVATKRTLLHTVRGGDGPGIVNGHAPLFWLQGGAGNLGLNLADVTETWDATDNPMSQSF